MSTIIDLGKLRFLWRGQYSAGSSYELNDVVLYGGNSYVYINTQATSGNLPDNATYWSLMSNGLTLRGAWDSATTYVPGDIINVSGIQYKCIQKSTSHEPPHATYWEVFIEGFIIFQILWKSRCHILVTFLSHLKKLRSTLRF